MDSKLFFDKLDNAQKVLVGIDKGFLKNCNDESILVNYNKLAKLLSGKDYFIVNLSKDTVIKSSDLDLDKVAMPLDETISIEDNEKRWNEYTQWLQMTLNKDMLLIELGVGFELPTLVRWPFEKIALYNNKAYLYRVNEIFPQLPDDIAKKGEAVKSSVDDFLSTIYAERFGN